MTATASLARRVFLLSTRRSTSRSLQRPKYSTRRLQATAASVQPSYATPPPPPYAAQRPGEPQNVSAYGQAAYRVPEQRQNEWQAPSEG